MKQSVKKLHQAVINKDSREINQLFKQRDFDVDAQNNQGYTPLFIAAFNGYIGVVRILLQKKANPALQCNHRTPLYMAASQGHVGVVQILLLYKADHTVGCGSDNTTPLHVAAQNGCVKVVEALLWAGESIPIAK